MGRLCHGYTWYWDSSPSPAGGERTPTLGLSSSTRGRGSLILPLSPAMTVMQRREPVRGDK